MNTCGFPDGFSVRDAEFGLGAGWWAEGAGPESAPLGLHSPSLQRDLGWSQLPGCSPCWWPLLLPLQWSEGGRLHSCLTKGQVGRPGGTECPGSTWWRGSGRDEVLSWQPPESGPAQSSAALWWMGLAGLSAALGPVGTGNEGGGRWVTAGDWKGWLQPVGAAVQAGHLLQSFPLPGVGWRCVDISGCRPLSPMWAV